MALPPPLPDLLVAALTTPSVGTAVSLPTPGGPPYFGVAQFGYDAFGATAPLENLRVTPDMPLVGSARPS